MEGSLGIVGDFELIIFGKVMSCLIELLHQLCVQLQLNQNFKELDNEGGF